MNRIALFLLSALTATGLLTRCTKPGRDLDVNISAVQSLFAPTDNTSVKLQPATSAAVLFQWDQARAEDGTLVLYEVAFDQAAGDFSKPIFKLTSDQNGVLNQATISHKDLNRIAALAGIGSLGTGNLKWTVLASRGINVKQAAQSRTITLERPAGFDVVPSAVFLTGSATEAGADVAKAIPMKSTGPGTFELYTSLKPGTYSFVDRVSGTAKTYSISGVNIKEGGNSTATDAQQPVRIRLDFANAAASLTQIKEVGLWYAADNDIRFTLDYVGGGVWQALNKKIDFAPVPWGKDERYKFRLKTVTNGTAAEEWLGSSNADNSRPDANSPASYYYLLPIGASQWDYTYKFSGAVDSKNVDLQVSLAPTATYFHKVTIN